jgi:hypothetical protein
MRTAFAAFFWDTSTSKPSLGFLFYSFGIYLFLYEDSICRILLGHTCIQTLLGFLFLVKWGLKTSCDGCKTETYSDFVFGRQEFEFSTTKTAMTTSLMGTTASKDLRRVYVFG